MSKKYPQVYEGEWVTPPRRGFREQCCDCGLIHRVNYRLVKTLNGGNKIQFQVFRDNRATGQVRRAKKNGSKDT